MAARRSTWGLVALVCACERAPTRLERVSSEIAVQTADEDLERGRAALKELKGRTIAPPPGRSDAELARLSLVVSAAKGELDAEIVEIVETRLALMRLAGRVERDGATIAVSLPEAPREKVPAIAAAIGAQGRLQVAHLESERRREQVRVDDSAIRWASLPVERVESAQPAEPPALTVLLSPDGAAALARATGQGGYMALAFDDVVLSVPRVDAPVSGGQLTLGDRAEESGDPRGAVGVLAVALMAPSRVPLKVEVAAVEEAFACADRTSCEAACISGSRRGCLRVGEARAAPQELSEAIALACTGGDGDACTRVCARGEQERCAAAIGDLLDVRSAWNDPRHAAALEVGLCGKGDLAACSGAMLALMFGSLGPGDFVTADAMLREIRDEALLVQATAMRQLVLDQAREVCREADEPELGAGACLFVAQSHAGGVLAPRDPAAEEDALRRAGKFLRTSQGGRRAGDA